MSYVIVFSMSYLVADNKNYRRQKSWTMHVWIIMFFFFPSRMNALCTLNECIVYFTYMAIQYIQYMIWIWVEFITHDVSQKGAIFSW